MPELAVNGPLKFLMHSKDSSNTPKGHNRHGMLFYSLLHRCNPKLPQLSFEHNLLQKIIANVSAYPNDSEFYELADRHLDYSYLLSEMITTNSDTLADYELIQKNPVKPSNTIIKQYLNLLEKMVEQHRRFDDPRLETLVDIIVLNLRALFKTTNNVQAAEVRMTFAYSLKFLLLVTQAMPARENYEIWFKEMVSVWPWWDYHEYKDLLSQFYLLLNQNSDYSSFVEMPVKFFDTFDQQSLKEYLVWFSPTSSDLNILDTIHLFEKIQDAQERKIHARNLAKNYCRRPYIFDLLPSQHSPLSALANITPISDREELMLGVFDELINQYKFCALHAFRDPDARLQTYTILNAILKSLAYIVASGVPIEKLSGSLQIICSGLQRSENDKESAAFLRKFKALAASKSAEETLLCLLDDVKNDLPSFNVLLPAVITASWNDNSAASPIPYPLLLSSDGWEEAEQSAFLSEYRFFAESFNKCAQQVSDTERHTRDFDTFMYKYQILIASLAQVMGKDTFAFFKKYIGMTVLPLERLFDGLEPLPESFVAVARSVFSKYPRQILTDQYKLFAAFLQLVAIYLEIERNEGMDLRSIISFYEETLKSTSDFAEFYKKANERLFKDCLQLLGIDPEKVLYEEASARLRLEQFPMLIAGRGIIKRSGLQTVFDELLLLDIKGGSFVDFIHKTSQESQWGATIAKHNQRIQEQLRENNIDVNLAFNYTKTTSFVCHENEDMQTVSVELRSVWNLLNELYEKLIAFKNESAKTHPCEKLKPLEKVIKKIEEFRQKIVGKNGRADEISLSELSKMRMQADHLDFIKRLCLNLGNKNDITSSPELNNLISAFNAALSKLNKLLAVDENRTIKLTRPKSFRIEAWDKSKLATYYLGNDVGCCLSTNSVDFPAVLLRRIDDAAFMHVVIDEETNKPISLAWLYFARSTSEPGKVYVVANFLELSATNNYHKCKETILGNLLLFTHEYVEAIKAAGFLIGHLSYGKIPDLHGFEQKALNLQKIGGFVCKYSKPDGQDGEYKLVSVHSQLFHEFSPKGLPLSFTAPAVNETVVSAATAPIAVTAAEASATAIVDSSELDAILGFLTAGPMPPQSSLVPVIA